LVINCYQFVAENKTYTHWKQHWIQIGLSCDHTVSGSKLFSWL